MVSPGRSLDEGGDLATNHTEHVANAVLNPDEVEEEAESPFQDSALSSTPSDDSGLVSEATSSSGASTSENSNRDEDSTESGDEMPNEHSPRRKKAKWNGATADLKSRLSTFLPQLHQANAELEDAGNALASRIDDVGDDEDHYIEMNLGLGVFKEVPAGQDTVATANDSESDTSTNTESSDGQDVIGKLTGRKSTSTKRKIEEVSS